MPFAGNEQQQDRARQGVRHTINIRCIYEFRSDAVRLQKKTALLRLLFQFVGVNVFLCT